MTGNDRAVLYARSETVQNDQQKKLFIFHFFKFASGQNKAFLQVTRKSTSLVYSSLKLMKIIIVREEIDELFNIF
jgi:hypothetical protein